MQKQVQLQVTPSEAADPAVIKQYVANAGGHAITAVTGFHILKKSIDARSSKQVWINLTLQAFIDEPFGRLDTDQKKDSVWNNIKSLGRNTLYTQTSNLNYNIPFNKFPLTNFITTSLRYSGKYDWQAAPLSMDTLGNNISNSNTKQVNAQLNLINFYNKFPYLKKISQKTQNHQCTKRILPHRSSSLSLSR